MIPYEEALERVLAQAGVLPPEQVELRQALGRILARDVMTREAIPLFDQSAVDGYGVRAADLAEIAEGNPARLKVVGEVRAGEAQPKSFSRPGSTLRGLKPGEAIQIFTGAMVPRGVDTVVMREVCAEVAGEGLQKKETRIGKSGRVGIVYEHEHEMRAVLIRQKVMEGANIRCRGEEFAKGTCVLRTGTRITPPVIGLLATLGYPRPMVHRTPNVTLLVTGSELKEPGERLGPGQIRDANGYALAAALEAMGMPMLSSTRVGDDPEAIRKALTAALKASDVVVTAGGVSVGDYDFIKDVAAELGVETVFWKVAIKPGMPNYFGTYAPGKVRGKGKKTGEGAAKKLLFGLPGNPVAALVSFYLFVRPALLAMAGSPDPRPKLVQATLKGERRKTNKRLEWVRGVLEESTEGWAVTPAGGQESHMLGGLAGANGLIEFPAEATVLEDGAEVRVLPLEWVV